MPKRRIEFTIWGEPKTKGSVTAFKAKNSDRVIVSHGKKSKAWESICADAASEAMGDAPVFESACAMYVLFTLPQAASNKTDWPAGKTFDLDKLLRALWDGLTGRLWDDDGRCAEVHGKKLWVGADGALPRPGVRVVVEEL